MLYWFKVSWIYQWEKWMEHKLGGKIQLQSKVVPSISEGGGEELSGSFIDISDDPQDIGVCVV